MIEVGKLYWCPVLKGSIRVKSINSKELRAVTEGCKRCKYGNEWWYYIPDHQVEIDNLILLVEDVEEES